MKCVFDVIIWYDNVDGKCLLDSFEGLTVFSPVTDLSYDKIILYRADTIRTIRVRDRGI